MTPDDALLSDDALQQRTRPSSNAAGRGAPCRLRLIYPLDATPAGPRGSEERHGVGLASSDRAGQDPAPKRDGALATASGS